MDGLKDLFKDPKKRNIFLIGVVVVVILAFMARGRKSGGSEMVALAGYPGSVEGGAGGGVPHDVVAALEDSFGRALDAQGKRMDEMSGQYSESLNILSSAFGSALSGLQSQIQEYDELTRTMTSQYQADISGLQNQIAQLVAEKAASKPTTTVSTGGGGTDATPFVSPPVSHNPISITTQKTLTAVEQVFGAGGANYSDLDAAGKAQMQANREKEKNDQAYREAEIQRTLSVIQNRQAAGMDTSAQEKYLRVNLGYAG